MTAQQHKVPHQPSKRLPRKGTKNFTKTGTEGGHEKAQKYTKMERRSLEKETKQRHEQRRPRKGTKIHNDANRTDAAKGHENFTKTGTEEGHEKARKFAKRFCAFSILFLAITCLRFFVSFRALLWLIILSDFVSFRASLWQIILSDFVSFCASLWQFPSSPNEWEFRERVFFRGRV